MIKITDCSGYGGTFSGTATNCTGGDYSFGGSEASGGSVTYPNGGFYNCKAGNISFCGYGTISGTFKDCIGGNYSFGGSPIVAISGKYTNCIGGTDSFGGGGGGISANARLYNCRLTSGTFGTPEDGAKLINCIDGNYNVFFLIKTLLLDKDNWVGLTQTVTVNGITDDNQIVINTPINRNEFMEYAACFISVISTDVDSLTFEAITIPTIDININIEIK